MIGHALRHAAAACFLLPLLLTLLLTSPEQLSVINDTDRAAVALFNYIGDASFALTGALAAGEEGMDLMGCLVVGFVTALGGGTFRDIVLGRTPVFWLTAWDEAALAPMVSGLAFFCWPAVARRLRLTTEDEWLFWTDTVGLGAFAANGAYVGSSVSPRSPHVGGAALCGMFTATFGGLTRDVLLRRPVRILHSHAEIYAAPALLGGAATALWLRAAPTQVEQALLLGLWLTIQVRVLALNRGLALPTFAARGTSTLPLSPAPYDSA